MQKTFLIIVLLGLWLSQSYAQPTGYYNGTEGLTGDDLKTALNGIIDDHVQYSYYSSKTIFKLSDADPNNPNNVILVYTGRSEPNNNYGTGGNYINREHVWAKSHGNFDDVHPMDNDVHNLKPADASVNVARSNKDFDNGGVQHPEATGCYYTDSTWEARDEVKGDIARIIFYMDTRYEGNNGESNLSVVDYVNTSPFPEHGKLSTLLEWNEMDPPDEFERNRNDVIFSWQKNRNPFIDNPEYVNLIWAGQQVSPISFSNFVISSIDPIENQIVNINATVSSSQGSISEIILHWGLDFENLNNVIEMENVGGDNYTVEIPGQNGTETVYYQIVASDGTNTSSSIIYNYYVWPVFTGDITTIYDIQGQTDVSPYDGEIVNTTGIVTANFGENYFIQDGYGEWNGLFIYDLGRNPNIGDSIVLTGLVDEYYNKTEIKEISDYYYISANNTLPDPVLVQTGSVEEGHESVLVKVNNAICTDDNYQAQENHFMWTVDDGSGELRIHNTPIFEYVPSEGSYYNITGPMNYDFDEWKIEIRFESDVTDGGDFDGPSVIEVTPVISTNIKVLFNEAVETTTAENVSNYMINNGGVIESVVQHTFNKAQVNMTVSPLNGDYELTVQNVEDVAGNVMEPQTIPFSHVGIEKQIFDGNISIYPNPTSDYFILNISPINNLDKELMLTINNVSGQTILTRHYTLQEGGNNFEINTSMLDKGLYIIKISSTGKSGVQKLLIY